MCVRVKQFLFQIWTRVLYCLEFCFKIFTRPKGSKQRHQKPENDSPSKKIKIDTSEHCNNTVAIKKLSVANLKPCGRRSRYSDTMVDPNNRSADSSRLRNRGLSFDEEYVLSEQKRFQKKSFEYISQALEIDENSTDMTRKEEAILFYKKGIEELEKGINVFILGQGEKFDRAKDLRAKMQKNLLMAQDRLQILAKLVSEAPEERTAGAGPTVNPSQRAATSTTGSKTVVSVGGRTTVFVGDRSSSAAGAKSSNLHKRTSSLPRSNPQAVKPNRSLQPTKFTNSVKPTSKDAPAASKDSTKRPSLNCLKNMDKNLVNLILDEIIDGGPAMTFNDVAGQETSKQALQEIVILPSLRPELFTGLRSPARGLLLFGPPGNGKTMLARAVASESNSTFFNISAASLTSKWLGEAEKLVRALFAAARELQPSIIFIDEIDSLLCERRENEHEASRRIKTQFLIEFQGVQSGEGDDRVLVMGATNRPYELDDAVLRRFPKRIYVPMPCIETRHVLLSKLLSKQGCSINESQIMHIASLTEGYSASDLTSLAKDAALGPIRELGPTQVKSVDVRKLRDINVSDFLESLRRIRPSVPTETFAKLDNWNRQYGDVST